MKDNWGNSAPANEVVELWATAAALLRSDSLAPAADTARRLAEILKDEPPGRISTFDWPIHGEVVVLMAAIAYRSNDLPRADQLFNDAVAELRQNVGTSRVPLAKALTGYAPLLVEQGKKAEASAALRDAISTLAPAVFNQEDGAFELLRVVADKATSIGESKLAEAALVAGIEASKKNGRPETHLIGYYLSLATVRANDRRADDALEPAQESLRLAREASLPSKDIARITLELATIHLKLQHYQDVRALANEATVLAPDDSELMFRARNLEGLALRTDVPEEAITVLTEAVRIATNTWGAYSNETIKARENLANLFSDLNRHLQAYSHWEFVKDVREYQFGANSLEFGKALSSYAVSVDQVGQHARADRLYRKALAIFRHHLGDAHADVLMLRYNLAELARAGGALGRSAFEFHELEQTWRSIGQIETNAFVRMLKNFGLTLISLRRFSEAREKLEEARAILAKHASTESPLYARVLLGFAQLEYASRNHAGAILLFEQAAAGFREREEFSKSLEEAEFGASCSAIHIERTDAAVERAREELTTAIKRHGTHDPMIVSWSQWLALALFDVRRLRQAREALEQTDSGTRIALIETVLLEGEQNVGDVVQKMRDFQMLHLSLVLADTSRDEAATTKAYEMLISLRGAETTILRLRGRSSPQSNPAELKRRIQQLKKAIVALELSNPERKAARVAADLQEHRSELQRVESELLDRVNGFRLDFDFIPPALTTIAQSLGTDTALVEFASYREIDTTLGNPLAGPERYVAFVVRGGTNSVRLFELGPASEIDRLIHEFRQAVINQPRRKVKADEAISWRAPATALAGLLLNEPMREAIVGIRKLVIVPEGKIALVPLAALPSAGGFLCDDFEINYRFASREVRRFKFAEDLGLGGVAAVIGAPDYGLQTGGSRSDPLDDGEFLSQFRSGQRFEALGAAVEECSDIARLLGVDPLLGKDATETAVKALDSPEALHISTHGFVLEQVASPALAAEESAWTRAKLEDPMERSGLAFAGANAFLDGAELSTDAEDGILYASEVLGINLMRTDIVTLSACQTGLGDLVSGDGVHGLQRAFTAAGARTVVCSLWEVPDKPTRKFFTRFYEELLVKKRPRGDALQIVIRELAHEYPLNPVAWGGFVLYGETDVLTRHHPLRNLKIASFSASTHRTPPNSPAREAEDLIMEGRRRRREGNAAGALEAFNAALEVRFAPNVLRGNAMFERAGVLRESGEFEAALEAYNALAQMQNLPDPFRASIEISRGLTYLLAGNHDKAIEHYSTGLAFDGFDLATRASVLVNRGLAHWELNHSKEALADLNTVIDTRGMPQDQQVKAILAKAEIYIRLGQYENAESEVNNADAFDLTPDETATATLLWAQIWAAQGRIDEAIANVQKVLTEQRTNERYRQIASTLLAQFIATSQTH
ncbi:MAG TPA: CHAT domain-containing protein [Pyrinomonadaceae bacterium]|nr:CHAT domain-containing protein [Pyrinomonadaceae bacterium]